MSEYASCCILAFNRPKFLQQMIGTMVANAGHPMEIIVHDDGSTDKEQREWLHYMVDQGRISTLIENPPGWNQGQGVALNRMFTMASGDPIIKLDHDLIFREGWLRQSVDVINANHNSQKEPLIGCLGLFHYDADPVDHRKMHVRDWSGWEEVQDFVGSAMVIPRETWEMEGPFEERSPAFAEDAVFKQKVTMSPYWTCGLLSDDVVTNQGFGVGPSTLVIDHDHNLQSIHETPKIIYPNGVAA